MKERLQGFRHAARGIRTLLRTQANARLHLAASVAVIAAALFFRVTRSDWCWLVAASAAVWAAEAINTALEFLADAVTREQHPLIGRAKDCAAGAVLFAALGAAVIGALVFAPYVAARFGR